MYHDDRADRQRIEAALAEALSRQADLEQRLVALVAASGTLFGSPKVEDVLPGVIVLARTLIAADGYALWRFDPEAQVWRMAEAYAISTEFERRIVGSFDGDPTRTLPFTEPLVAESLSTVTDVESRMQIYRDEGIASLLAVPLTIAGRASGTLVFYYRTPHVFSDIEVHTASALSNLAAAAITTAELYDEQRRSRERAEQANRQAAFLAEASAALGSSLNYEETLRTVAQLAVPQIADWCAVDVLDEHGEVQRLAVAHIDPARVELARTFQQRYPPDPNSPASIARVIRTGQPFMLADITDAMLVAGARDPEHLRTLRDLAIRSVIIVPLTAHRRTFGALTFVSAESGRRYTADDFRFAEDVAFRSALAVENARAYGQVNAANRAKDEFLATLSHELRTPLNAVLGWARMLREGTITPAKMPRAFAVIERNALAQLDLVEDLLDLSRIITGKFRLDVGPVDLALAVDAAIEAVQPAATAKGITLTVEADQDSGVVAGDAARIQQVVWNLLSNAIKFTPRDGQVTVSRRRRDGAVEIEVTDTGEGIAPHVLPYVFDRFRQGESGTTRTHMGLGLGLAIVRHIVELHGGRVDVASDGEGLGARFRIVLPVVQAAGATSGRAASVPDARPPVVTLEGVRALVVDDDDDARDLVAEVLRSRGAAVTTVASALEGLDALDREVPDVLLSDIAMPGMDGIDLIRRVRARPRELGGDVPAVALTAHARVEDSDRSLASGFHVHLSKPLDLEALLSTVATLAERRRF
jgi:signal transduction histidine kinase/ActR/RegA family two-component response regulator